MKEEILMYIVEFCVYYNYWLLDHYMQACSPHPESQKCVS